MRTGYEMRMSSDEEKVTVYYLESDRSSPVDRRRAGLQGGGLRNSLHKSRRDS